VEDLVADAGSGEFEVGEALVGVVGVVGVGGLVGGPVAAGGGVGAGWGVFALAVVGAAEELAVVGPGGAAVVVSPDVVHLAAFGGDVAGACAVGAVPVADFDGPAGGADEVALVA
jgi:hypothetical protein